MPTPRIAFVSRELDPTDPDGTGAYVLAAAAALAQIAEVTLLTADDQKDATVPEGVSVELIDTPRGQEADYWYSDLHLWSARAYEALRRAFPDGGPDLVEFPDRGGAGCVTAQAIQTADRGLRNTTLCVRAYGTQEMQQVLDGFVAAERRARTIFELERYALAHADYFLWPGGGVLDTYRGFFDGRIASPVQVPHPLPSAGRPPTDPDSEGPLRMLYIGSLARRKGVQNLIRAANSLGLEDWTLTLAGDDTQTAPLGQSMRQQLELMAAEDPRIEFAGPLSGEQRSERYEAADVIVSPSLWDCWPLAVLEAFDHNRPVLATPVGGHSEMIEPDRCGRLTEDPGPEAIATAIEGLIAGKAERAGEVTRPRGPGERFRELTDAGPIRDRYLELLERATPGRGWSARPPAVPLVSVVVPYFRMEEHLEETLASIREQTHPRIEVVLVNDGSLRAEDAIVEALADRYDARLVTQPNSGLGAARNLGVGLARGRYVLPVDPDDTLLPTIRRALRRRARAPPRARLCHLLDRVHGRAWRPSRRRLPAAR